jgi:hypothetical protein
VRFEIQDMRAVAQKLFFDEFFFGVDDPMFGDAVQRKLHLSRIKTERLQSRA